jgi:hypothetical protein
MPQDSRLLIAALAGIFSDSFADKFSLVIMVVWTLSLVAELDLDQWI